MAEEHYVAFLDSAFLSIRRGKATKELVYLALGLKPDGPREILDSVFLAEGESTQNWEEVLRDLWRRGVRKVRIFVTDDLLGLEEAIGKIFPEADGQLCVLHDVRDALNQARKKDREALAEDLRAVYRAERTGGQGSAKEATGTLGNSLSPHRGPLGGQGLRSTCVSPAFSADPLALVHHASAGAAGQGGEASN